MKAMVLEKPGQPLVLVERPDPLPGPGQIRLKVEACAVCRTDLHVVDGELERPKLPLVPGHEIVGVIDAVGTGVDPSRTGRRVGVPWLGHTCGACDYCRSGAENLCDAPLFTGYTRDGGFATHVVADADFAFDLDEAADPVALAPLLCAGLIGWRSLKKAGEGKRIGLYGFGAAAHIIAQVCRWQTGRFTLSQSPEIRKRKILRAALARYGPEIQIFCRRHRWMQLSFSHPPGSSFQPPCVRCARAAGWSAAASI
ncbi:hypothetical protein P053_00792 [Brucella abortus 01-4165]|uniref:Adh n=1 Tax=Brucella abortus TaxID=235 RepID=O54388_BRUAO|nr:adh [Brucella abortus]AEW17784.1 alcohol dehydrogenase [Brucella abortus A13334]AIJ60707.1 alcohol dehydrogenase GroES-like domain protein [Brucella abortus bv. 9 str. C68]AIJ64232.1 alcohol dehydrogenase GroES-like domain protein [Brucella abortus bv. 6 str. 870]AIJ93144.1 alcohol dehydrogenase GroES-like domain protein [Brucella abortus bv. 2 str. 86/8/59]EEW80553.1 alcohol dehydrogenase [Brucella abortus NCTC 8038]EEX55279.1 alcohol dehydrogenase [Brucella abortus bv. 4 str. 292]EEX825